MSGNLLELQDVHTYSGLAYLLRGVSLDLQPGEAVALLGRNGEGKTPTLKTIMSVLPPSRGQIMFEGKSITGRPTHVVARKGIGLVPRGRHIFPALSVIEHLRVPCSGIRSRRQDLLARVFEVFPELKGRDQQPARSLSGGEQQMLVVGRALMTNPRLLLLDEPFEGLAPVAVKRVVESVKGILKDGVAVLVASASCERALSLARRAYIIEKGKIVYRGTCSELAADHGTRQKHLGVKG